MEITRAADYAIRIMVEVAYQALQGPGQLVTIAQVARRRLVPGAFLRQIVPQLVAANLLQSRRGPRGGLALARSPEEISVLDILQAVQQPIATNICVLDPRACPIRPICPMHEVHVRLSGFLVAELETVRLDALARQAAELRARPRAPVNVDVPLDLARGAAGVTAVPGVAPWLPALQRPAPRPRPNHWLDCVPVGSPTAI